MSHMEAQITRKMEWLEVDGLNGTEYYPLDDVHELATARGFLGRRERSIERSGRLPPSRAEEEFVRKFSDVLLNDLYHPNTSAKIIRGYGVRSSAPGYMDATEWTVYGNLREAKRALAEEERALRGED